MQDGGLVVRRVPVARCPEVNRATVTPDAQREKLMKKKLTLSKETLRTLDEKELSLVVGGGDQSGSNTPPNGGPNSCPNTKPSGCH